MQSIEDASSQGKSTANEKFYKKIDDSLLRSISWICRRYGLGRTDEALIAGLPRAPLLTPSLALEALKNAGITGGLVQRNAQELPLQLCPLILIRQKSGGCILLSSHQQKKETGKDEYLYQVILPELGDSPVEINHDELSQWYSGYAILAKPTAHAHADYADELPEKKSHWLFSTLWRYRRYYRSAALAAVLANVLTLATVFFTMNVYDRVIPNQAFVTLWSLAAGVTVAMVFEAITRYVRAHLLDVAGKKADLVLGSLLFRQALDVRMEHKPASTGAFASQIREFESVRDFIASASLAALSDLPFTLLFIAVIFVTGGMLGFIPHDQNVPLSPAG